MISFNIEDLKNQIDSTAHHIKSLLRETLQFQRHQQTAASNPLLEPIDFNDITDQLFQFNSLTVQYLNDLQTSSYINDNTTRDDNNGNIKRLQKLLITHSKA